MPVEPYEMKSTESEIILRPELEMGLDGLQVGQRILVLFHFHRSKGYELHQHPHGDKLRPKRGIFALHSPRRPNPIGATEVEVIALQGNVLWVRGLDALNGSPVLDIKPA